MDITKCSGDKCPIKESCHRYTASPSKPQYSIIAPFKVIDGVFSCDMFWGVGAQRQYELLKSITKGEL